MRRVQRSKIRDVSCRVKVALVKGLLNSGIVQLVFHRGLYFFMLSFTVPRSQTAAVSCNKVYRQY